MVKHDCHDTNSYIVAEDGRVVGIIEDVISEKNEAVERILTKAEDMRIKLLIERIARSSEKSEIDVYYR